jgi:hypothetical protein
MQIDPASSSSTKGQFSGLPVAYPPPTPIPGGYCRARQRLPLGMVTSLTAFVGQLIGHQMPGVWRWQNRRVHIVDGTTVTMPDTPANQAAFPQQRWQVELDIRNIKQTMGMDNLSCKTPDMAVKEIWVYLLAYNLIRLMMAQSALLADVVPRTRSFKHCLQLWTLWLQTESVLDEERLQGLLILMAQQVVGKRPGRIEPEQ